MPVGVKARRWVAFGAAAALMLAVTLWRQDLFLEAARVTWKQFQAGGSARNKLLVEVALFAGIMLYTLRVIPDRADFKRDGLRVALALAAGWAAEAWGTRLGLWSYYTRETPPLWIVPAWGLGTLVVERTGARWSGAAARIPAGRRRLLYGAAAALILGVVAAFSWPTLAEPATVAMLAAVAAALLVGVDTARDLPVLAAGFLCVLFADTWGTTNNCWRYWLQHGYGSLGLAGGVLFGATYDTALVLGCLKATEGLLGVGQRS
ncbi:MAG: hypothetical protein HYZ75_01415 [Elusimicrobia bacterium]|nr:hypothetical protein [Elusimicrobiota bacterium]